MKKIEQYFDEVARILDEVRTSQNQKIKLAAYAAAMALENSGTVYTFGTGHSHILAEEIFYRAGGLVKVYPILDEPLMLHTNASRSSFMERIPGYARTLIDSYSGIKPGDIMFIFSNSGRNTVSVDMAIEAKSKGMTVVCITNIKHSYSVTSRHHSGKKLYEVCDIVIDNCGSIGDAAIGIGNDVCGPTSTVVGAAIMQSVVCGTVEKLLADGYSPEVFKSGNIDGGDSANEKYIQKYRGEIRIL